MFDQYTTSPQAAKILNIDRVTVAKLIREGRLPATKISNMWLIEKSELEKFAQTYEGRPGRPTGWSPKRQEGSSK